MKVVPQALEKVVGKFVKGHCTWLKDPGHERCIP
jgi:hypothetical protein